MKRQQISIPAAVRAKEISVKVIASNAILTGLAPERTADVLADGTLVDLAVRQPIYRPGEQISDVYFPIDCVLSVVTRMQDGKEIEIGTIGREGVSAIPLLLGGTTSVNDSYCQVPGQAVKMGVAAFARLCENERFKNLLDRYVQAYVNMLGQLAACNRLHSVYERCSRWLLMTQDRVGSSEIHLTHEYLAMMLGTRRAGVTIAAGTLQQAGFITYGQGIITIVDRGGLESSSCECYEVARDQFGALLATVAVEHISSAAVM